MMLRRPPGSDEERFGLPGFEAISQDHSRRSRRVVVLLLSCGTLRRVPYPSAQPMNHLHILDCPWAMTADTEFLAQEFPL